MTVFAGVAIGLLLAFFCIRYASPVFGLKGAVVLLIVKLFAGLIAAAYYWLYAGEGDLLLYHKEASEWALALQTGYPFQEFALQQADPSAQLTPQARTFFFIKVVTLLYLVTGSNFWITGFLFSLFSYAAAVYFIRRLTPYLGHIAAAGVLIFFVWPGVAVWGSGLGKESLMLGAISLFLGALLPVVFGNSKHFLRHGTLFILSFVVLFKLRIFVLLVLVPCLVGGFVAHKLMQQRFTRLKKWQAGVAGLAGVVLVAVLLSYADQSFRPDYIFIAFEKNHAAVVAHSAPGHVVAGLEKLAEWPVVLLQVLLAMVAGILGPFVWEISSGWELLLLAEPVILLVLFFTNRRKQPIPLAALIPLVAYILIMSAFITLSTPNYGTLSRYRLAYYPMLVFLAGYNHPWLTKIID